MLARREEPIPLSTPQPGWAEQDPDDWVRATRRSWRRSAPTAVGFSGQMHGLVALDEHDDRVLRPAILWNDQRTAARVRGDRTANRPRAADRADRQPRAHRLHRAEAALAAHARAGRLRAHPLDLLPKDYVRLKLFGERAIDVADASGTLLFDVAHRRWSEEVLAALEIPGEWLPPSYESTGHRRRRGAATRRRATRGRRHRARPGVCRARDVRRRLRSARRIPAGREARVHVFCHAVPATWHAMGVMLSAAGSLQWLHDAIAPEASLRRSCSRRRRRGRPAAKGCCSRRTSPASARRTPTRTRVARSSGCRCATTAARSCGRCSKASRSGSATRSSCCASSACSPSVGRVSGGGARSELWLAIVASVLDLPLERPR